MFGGLVRALVAAVMVSGLVAPGAARELPHRLHVEPFFRGGQQVQVIVGFIISREECRQLIATYRDRAEGGQVSVHRPVKSKASGRGPWCVDNFHGRGITFSDDLFDWEEYAPSKKRW